MTIETIRMALTCTQGRIKIWKLPFCFSRSFYGLRVVRVLRV
ncbi:hypothetical protein Poly41_00660 [Novipirellula artificiosorum]|uniref:Uncharacterized protein n=1 Tax=Novipirellula artificiosorum TaxID=2528016 RepID=A0A5C6DZX8_9BACT|nr:hypothetical protein Poly41_00660 [Novipirellula artificiosorum]